MGGVTATFDARQFEQKLKAADVKARAQVASGLNRIGTLTANGIRGKMNRDTSYMANNVHATMATPALLVVVVTSAAKYTTWQDKGTKPFWPNTESGWGGWFARHPPKAKMSEASWRFLVGRAISKKGIKAHDFIDPVVVPAKAEALALMKNAVKGIW